MLSHKSIAFVCKAQGFPHKSYYQRKRDIIALFLHQMCITTQLKKIPNNA